MNFSGGGAGRLDLSRDFGSGEGERYEKITVRRRNKNSLIVKVMLYINSNNKTLIIFNNMIKLKGKYLY